MTRVLTVTHLDGTVERVPILCGSNQSARRVPPRIGRAVAEEGATAVLDYDNKPRSVVRVGNNYYTRIKETLNG